MCLQNKQVWKQAMLEHNQQLQACLDAAEAKAKELSRGSSAPSSPDQPGTPSQTGKHPSPQVRAEAQVSCVHDYAF